MLLRHQLSVLRQRVPSKPKLTVADRLLFIWLYRLFPSVCVPQIRFDSIYMQATEDRARGDGAEMFNDAIMRGVFGQGLVGSQFVVVARICVQDPARCPSYRIVMVGLRLKLAAQYRRPTWYDCRLLLAARAAAVLRPFGAVQSFVGKLFREVHHFFVDQFDLLDHGSYPFCNVGTASWCPKPSTDVPCTSRDVLCPCKQPAFNNRSRTRMP